MRRVACALALLALAGCGGGEGRAPDASGDAAAAAPEVSSQWLSPEQLLDPAACKDCHPNHYREWSGSMHAYAAEDPVFVAMNARGQRETGGELGTFCADCHAPMAVRMGLTEDGTNLAELPSWARGVTCAFCHSVDAIEGTHNAQLGLASDGVLRGGLRDPAPNPAHAMAYSPLHDRHRIESSDLCGVCHDIVTPAGVHLERTYLEWQESIYAEPTVGRQQTCGSCHMRGRNERAAEIEGAPVRRRHEHTFAAVDVAITPFPEREAQREAVQRELDPTLVAQVCVVPGDAGREVWAVLENIAAGHAWPSGSSIDRRAWVELVAYDGDGAVIFERGRIPEGEPVRARQETETDLWVLGDRGFAEDGTEVHMFWDVRRIEREVLPAPTAVSPLEPGYIDTHVTRKWPLPDGEAPARVELRVHLRPIGLDVLDDLIDSGDLAPEHRDAMPTFTLRNSQVEWVAGGGTCQPDFPRAVPISP